MAEDPTTVVQNFFRAWDTDGFEPAFRSFFHTDGVWQNNADPPRVGIEAIMAGIDAYLAAFQRPFARVELLHCAGAGNVVLTERIEHCENRDTGDTYVGHHMASFVVEAGKLRRFHDFFDPTDYRNGNALPKRQSATGD